MGIRRLTDKEIQLRDELHEALKLYGYNIKLDGVSNSNLVLRRKFGKEQFKIQIVLPREENWDKEDV
jgi:hypothetical protein